MNPFEDARARHVKRQSLLEQVGRLKFHPIMMTDEKRRKEYQDAIKEHQKNFLNECSFVCEDMRAAIATIIDLGQRLGVDPYDVFRHHFNAVPLDAESAEVLNRKDTEAAKKRGDVPGQKKMVRDDGTVCEEAKPAKKEKLTAENDPANPDNISKEKLKPLTPNEVAAKGKEAKEGKEPKAEDKAAPKTAVSVAFEKAKGKAEPSSGGVVTESEQAKAVSTVDETPTSPKPADAAPSVTPAADAAKEAKPEAPKKPARVAVAKPSTAQKQSGAVSSAAGAKAESKGAKK